jgi:hypothetical protein
MGPARVIMLRTDTWDPTLNPGTERKFWGGGFEQETGLDELRELLEGRVNWGQH